MTEPPAAAGGSFASPVPVIGLAHGSRHPGGAQDITALMAAVQASTGAPARSAYLDLAQPDLATVAAELAAAGHTRAVVVPLLFTEAFHATVDVPDAVVEAATATGLDLVVADILGTGEDVAAVLAGTLTDLDRAASIVLFAVGSSRPAANAAVAELAGRLGARFDRPAAAAFGTCDPRLEPVAATLPQPVAVVSLFLAEGLLLTPMRSTAAAHGWSVTEPLGPRAAHLVRRRYEAALAVSATG